MSEVFSLETASNQGANLKALSLMLSIPASGPLSLQLQWGQNGAVGLGKGLSALGHLSPRG